MVALAVSYKVTVEVEVSCRVTKDVVAVVKKELQASLTIVESCEHLDRMLSAGPRPMLRRYTVTTAAVLL